MIDSGKVFNDLLTGETNRPSVFYRILSVYLWKTKLEKPNFTKYCQYKPSEVIKHVHGRLLGPIAHNSDM